MEMVLELDLNNKILGCIFSVGTDLDYKEMCIRYIAIWRHK